MTRIELTVWGGLLAASFVGCGAEAKKIPEPTAEQKAEFAKQHDQAKAHSQQQTPAPGGGTSEAPK